MFKHLNKLWGELFGFNLVLFTLFYLDKLLKWIQESPLQNNNVQLTFICDSC